jgi:hypothetical protein
MKDMTDKMGKKMLGMFDLKKIDRNSNINDVTSVEAIRVDKNNPDIIKIIEPSKTALAKKLKEKKPEPPKPQDNSIIFHKGLVKQATIEHKKTFKLHPQLE